MKWMMHIKVYLFIVCSLTGFCFFPCSIYADTAEIIFYRADSCYRKLIDDPDRLKYRENWFPCITKFTKAHKKEPTGPFAAASLYMAGKMYMELYAHSFVASDKQEAIDYFTRVIRQFPKSDYKIKAVQAKKKFTGKPSSNTKKVKHPNVDPKKKSKTRPKIRTGELSITEDRFEAARHTKKKVRQNIFKQSKEKYKASIKQGAKSVKSTPAKIVKSVTETNGALKGERITITGMRVWSNPNYTRIVIDADNGTSYEHRLLDPSHEKPQRLYIDFENTRLGSNIEKIIPINDDLLTDARAGQYKLDKVRVVIDIKSFKNYKIFSLRNPFRTVIDVWGRDAGASSYHARAKRPGKKRDPLDSINRKKEKRKILQPEKPVRDDPVDYVPKNRNNVSSNGLARQLALRVKRIVIDPGHGGKDAGAIGYYKRVYEKNIVLSLAKRLASQIRREIGCDVVLTRSTDRFLSLEERTAIANTRDADLFISLHTNAHKSKRAYGIETYFLNLATDDDAILVAARENATTKKSISDLQTILNDLMQNSKINESSRLATFVQKSLYGTMKKRYSKIKNKGVKQAPFYVLLGAQMPAILIETSFISNQRECKRLTRADYQNDLCKAIVKGVRQYIEDTNPMALIRPKYKKKVKKRNRNG